MIASKKEQEATIEERSIIYKANVFITRYQIQLKTEDNYVNYSFSCRQLNVIDNSMLWTTNSVRCKHSTHWSFSCRQLTELSQARES